jgi:hypothetical protein
MSEIRGSHYAVPNDSCLLGIDAMTHILRDFVTFSFSGQAVEK